MLAATRAFAKSWVAKLLFALLIVSFGLIFNIRDVFHGYAPNAVITAGPREVTAAEFKQSFDSYKRDVQQNNGGQPVPNEEFVKGGVPQKMAESMATSESFGAWMAKIGLRPADQLFADQLRQAQIFFNPVTGMFDKDRYLSVLSEKGVSQKRFEQEVHDDIATSHFNAALIKGTRAPRIFGALEADFLLETRDASWFTVDPRLAGLPPKPTDAELQKFIQQNSAQLMQPERRVLTVALFTPKDLVAKVKVDPAELQKRFDFKKDSLSQAEKRNFVVVTTQNPQTAAQLAQALKSGQDPAAAAKAANAQAIPYQDRPKTAVADPAVAAAAFSLKPGEVSTPIKGELGWAVVKVAGVTPGHEVSFAEARPQLEAELRNEQAAKDVYDLVEKFEQERSSGASIVDAAKKLGVRTITLAPATAEGVTVTGQRLPKPLVETAFGQPKGGESDVEEAGNGEYFAVKVDDVIPAALPKLDEVRTELTQVWMRQQLIKRMQEKATQLSDRIKKGESLQAVAASVGAPIETQKNLSRGAQNPAVPAQTMEAVFAVGPGKPFIAPGARGIEVGVVDSVHPAPKVLAARAAEDRRPAISLDLLKGISASAQHAARELIRPKINMKKIDATLGLTTEEATPAGKKK